MDGFLFSSFDCLLEDFFIGAFGLVVSVIAFCINLGGFFAAGCEEVALVEGVALVSVTLVLLSVSLPVDPLFCSPAQLIGGNSS